MAGPLCHGPLSLFLGLLGPPSSAHAGARQRVGVRWVGAGSRRGGGRGPRSRCRGQITPPERGGDRTGGSLPPRQQDLPVGVREDSTQTEEGSGSSASYRAPNPLVLRALTPCKTLFFFPRENGGEDGDRQGNATCTSQEPPALPDSGVSLHSSNVPKPARASLPRCQCPQTGPCIPPPQ